MTAFNSASGMTPISGVKTCSALSSSPKTTCIDHQKKRLREREMQSYAIKRRYDILQWLLLLYQKVFYSHSHGIPMGFPVPLGIPFPCTSLVCKQYSSETVAQRESKIGMARICIWYDHHGSFCSWRRYDLFHGASATLQSWQHQLRWRIGRKTVRSIGNGAVYSVFFLMQNLKPIGLAISRSSSYLFISII